MGDALIAADIISEPELHNALQLANQTSQPLGRVLVDLKYVSQKSIDEAAAIQVLVLDGSLNGATAIKALGRAHRKDITLEDALRELGWAPPQPKLESELGILLVHSGLITKAIYEDALKSIAEQQSTIGEYLVLRNVLSHSLINAALQIIVLIAQEKITQKEGAALLKQFCSTGGSFWDALSAAGFDSKALRTGRLSLGEVLTQGGFISEAERISSVEKALAEKMMLGELLVQSGMISSRVLESALQVQEIARTGAVSESEAVEVLKSTERNSTSIREVLQSRITHDERDAADKSLELLIAAGILRQTDVAVALKKAQEFGVDPLRGLVVGGIIDRTVFEATRELTPAIVAGTKTKNEAIMLLNYVERGRCTLAEAIENIRNPPPPAATVELPQAQAASSKSAQTTGGKSNTQAGTKSAETIAKDFASLDQAVRKKLAPMFISRFLRSTAVLAVLYCAMLLFAKNFRPMELGLLFSLLLILDTIRLIVDLASKRKELYELRTLDIEGVQQHPGSLKRRKDDIP